MASGVITPALDIVLRRIPGTYMQYIFAVAIQLLTDNQKDYLFSKKTGW